MTHSSVCVPLTNIFCICAVWMRVGHWWLKLNQKKAKYGEVLTHWLGILHFEERSEKTILMSGKHWQKPYEQGLATFWQLTLTVHSANHTLFAQSEKRPKVKGFTACKNGSSAKNNTCRFFSPCQKAWKDWEVVKEKTKKQKREPLEGNCSFVLFHYSIPWCNQDARHTSSSHHRGKTMTLSFGKGDEINFPDSGIRSTSNKKMIPCCQLWICKLLLSF